MEADKIVNHRRDERDREYGGFSRGMIKTAKIATELCNKEITPEDAYKILMALKLSRLAHSAKFDSFVDLIGYTEGWWNYIQEQEDKIHKDHCICEGRKDVPKHNLILKDPVKIDQAAWQDIMTTAAGIDPDKPVESNTHDCPVCKGKCGWFDSHQNWIQCIHCGGIGKV